uniref:Uncharacterized protein n=1 Tax=Tanacetum cinerariifolium TaxID=118510 RepID=A0A699GFZ0_TANCI|nr:hypothetical protein [Tanacetum cinerariifolium]
MATMIEQQVALDEALVPSTKRLWIGRSNFRLPSDIQSKESTLQVVYNVLRRCPFFKAFLVTADVPKIYMQEFWATAYVHQYSTRFKMDNKKNIVDLETFRDMLHICPRVPGQSFDELPFEEEILYFLRFLGHSAQIKTLTDVIPSSNLVGLYHKRNIDYAFLIWEDFVYQVEHKNQKRSNEMYYPRFTKVIIHHFTTKKSSIPRRNKVNWHYARDDIMFSTIKVVSRQQNTQQYGALLPIELTNDEIKNTKAYKEYYACATGEAAPKPKASGRKKRSGLDTSITFPTAITTLTKTVAAAPRLTAAAKGKQPAKAKSLTDPSELGGSSTDKGTDDKDIDDKKDESDDGTEDDNDDDKDRAERDDDDDDDDDKEEIAKISEPEDTESGGGDDEETVNSENDGNGEEDQGLRVSEEQRLIEEEEADELYRDVDINQGRGLQLSADIEDSHVTLTPVNPDGQQESSSVSSQFMSSMLNPKSDAEAVSNILGIVHQYINQQMTKALREAVQIQTDRLRNSYQRENDEFLRTIDDNMKRIIKEQLKSQVKEQVSRILPRIEEYVNAKLEAKALVDAYEADKTILDSYGETAILKRRCEDDDDQEGPFAESNWGFKRRKEGGEPESARALLELATRSAGRFTTRSKSRQASASEFAFTEEPVQTTSQIEEPSHLLKKPLTLDRDWNKTLPAAQGNTQLWISDLAKQADSHSSFNELLDTPLYFSNFIMNRLGVDTLTLELLGGPTYELMRGTCNSLTELEYYLEEVYKATTDQLDWVNPEGQQYPHNLLQPLPMIPDNQGRRVIPFAHFINNDLEYLRGGASSQKYTTYMTKTKVVDYRHIKWIEDLVPRTMWIQEPINYDKHAL